MLVLCVHASDSNHKLLAHSPISLHLTDPRYQITDAANVLLGEIWNGRHVLVCFQSDDLSVRTCCGMLSEWRAVDKEIFHIKSEGKALTIVDSLTYYSLNLSLMMYGTVPPGHRSNLLEVATARFCQKKNEKNC